MVRQRRKLSVNLIAERAEGKMRPGCTGCHAYEIVRSRIHLSPAYDLNPATDKNCLLLNVSGSDSRKNIGNAVGICSLLFCMRPGCLKRSSLLKYNFTIVAELRLREKSCVNASVFVIFAKSDALSAVQQYRVYRHQFVRALPLLVYEDGKCNRIFNTHGCCRQRDKSVTNAFAVLQYRCTESTRIGIAVNI